MKRLLVLCTHNSARSQMAEGWLRRHAQEHGLDVDIWSAGTERTFVKAEAVDVMREVGIDLSAHTSKAFGALPDPWCFDLVMTVCDSADMACPAYPAETQRLHVPFLDPSGHELATWRQVRDAIGRACEALITVLARGEAPDESRLRLAATAATTASTAEAGPSTAP